MMLDLCGVAVRRGERLVVDDVTLSVAAGECLALIGPNGAGKSSLVGAIGGDLPVASGSVAVQGVDLRHLPSRERARRRAVLTQQVAVALGFTVHEVVAMGREPWRGTPASADDDERIRLALAAVDVVHLAHRPVQGLSGGEQARVAIARTLAQDAPVMVWDEPTAALDIEHQISVMRTLRERVDAGGSAVLVVHDLTLAAQVADRVAVLANGRLHALGTPEEVLTTELVRGVYRAEVEAVVTADGVRALVPAIRRGVVGRPPR